MERDYVLRGSCLCVRLPEEVDHETGEIVRRHTDMIMSKNYVQSIVFDFGRTEFMDSSGIGLLMGRYRALGMKKGCVAAVGVSERISRILYLSGMHKIVSIEKE